MNINSIKEYYELSEKGIQDQFAVSLILSDIGNKSTPQTALLFFIESEILNNCTYREYQFVFWPTIAGYKFDKLGFSSAEDLNSAVISYLKARLMISKSFLFLAKYHHALWHSSTQDKHIHGRQAIENYIAHISSCLLKKNAEKECGNLIDYLRSLDTLIGTLKHKVEDSNALFIKVVQTREFLPAWFVFYTIEIIYSKRNQFTKEFNLECLAVLKECFQKEDLDSLKESIYILALKYSAILNVPILNLHDSMGYFYFGLASNRTKDKGDFLNPEFYARAIHFFNLSGNTEMYSKLSSEYQKVKANHELAKISFSGPIVQEHSNIILAYKEMIKKHIVNLNSNQLIAFVCISEHFVPHRNVPATKIPFLDYAQGSFYDKNNNFNHTANGGLFDPKALEIQLFIMDTLKDIFKYSIESNKLTAEIFIDHLENKSWIGKNESSKYWTTLLKPGIMKFFSLYKNHSSENSVDENDLILTFDTLAIKIEGLLRTYGKLNNVNITKIMSEKNAGGKNVETREVFMHELFTDDYPTFKELFEEKEYEFLRYLYLKNGLNIRNDIAHSFYKPENYSVDKLLLIVLSIFRISYYKIKS